VQSISRSAFRPVRRTKVTAEIVNQVRGLMAAGHLRPGERLPPEREFAQTLGIGRWSLRGAIWCMKSLGLVEVRPGMGTFLRPQLVQCVGPSPRVPEPAPSTDSRAMRINRSPRRRMERSG
jgi:DNA-binding FadR family transcriptional regulator